MSTTPSHAQTGRALPAGRYPSPGLRACHISFFHSGLAGCTSPGEHVLQKKLMEQGPQGHPGTKKARKDLKGGYALFP